MILKTAALPKAAQALIFLVLFAMAGCVETGTYEVGIVHNPTTTAPPLNVVAHFPIPAMPGGIQDFSGIETSDGVNIMLLSDHGFVAVARLDRGYDQQIRALNLRQVTNLRDESGAVLPRLRHYAEDLSVDSRGRIFVSFEQESRVDLYARLDAPAQSLGRHSDFDILDHSASFEAVAVDRQGTVYAIPEHAARLTYGFPSYRWRDGEWTGSFRLPQEYHFYPVSADFGPDGLLYVLERERGAQGIRSQVRRFSVQGRAITTPQVVMRTEYNQFGNLEGLSVFRDWNGRIRLLMVSDNNLSPTRPGELLDVALSRW